MNFCKMECTPKGYSYRRAGPNVKVVGIKYNATYKEVITLAAKALQVSAEGTVLVYRTDGELGSTWKMVACGQTQDYVWIHRG